MAGGSIILSVTPYFILEITSRQMIVVNTCFIYYTEVAEGRPKNGTGCVIQHFSLSDCSCFPGSHPLACTNQPESLASSDVHHMAVNKKMARRVERNIGVTLVGELNSWRESLEGLINGTAIGGVSIGKLF
jgi:hypothetical protein